MFRFVLFTFFLTVVLTTFGFALGGSLGVLAALILSIMVCFVSYWCSPGILLRLYKAKPLKDERIKNITKRLSTEANISEPRLYVVDFEAPNAFATGRSSENSVIVVTKGVLSLDENEIEAVLSHEVGHIKNMDILISSTVSVISGIISYIGQACYWKLIYGERKMKRKIIGFIPVIIFAPVAALLIRLTTTRTRDYKADHTGALLTKKPGYLATSLRKMNERARKSPIRTGLSATSNIWTVSPFPQDFFDRLFSTHPPLERRIERLEEMEER